MHPQNEIDKQTATPRKPRRSAVEILHDPKTVAVSISQASEILGIAKSTAHNAYRQTGYLCAGVPVLRVGKRCIVPITYLRAALGLTEKQSNEN